MYVCLCKLPNCLPRKFVCNWTSTRLNFSNFHLNPHICRYSCIYWRFYACIYVCVFVCVLAIYSHDTHSNKSTHFGIDRNQNCCNSFVLFSHFVAIWVASLKFNRISDKYFRVAYKLIFKCVIIGDFQAFVFAKMYVLQTIVTWFQPFAIMAVLLKEKNFVQFIISIYVLFFVLFMFGRKQHFIPNVFSCQMKDCSLL